MHPIVRLIQIAFAVSLAALAAIVPGSPAAAADRHAGYYYPNPSTESYVSRAQTLATSSREQRVAFVIALTGELMSRPYPPQYSIFAKGDQAEKLIIVALSEGAISSLYQARALLAQLTSVARASDFFREMAVDDIFTFLDLGKLLGFQRLTVSDGRTYAHQIAIQ
jgi:hypothetical protein